MSGRPVDGSAADENDAEDLLRELIPDEAPSSAKAADGLPVWSRVPTDEVGSASVANQSAPGGAATTGSGNDALLPFQPNETRGRSRSFWVITAALASLLAVAVSFGVGVAIGSDSTSDETESVVSSQVDDGGDPNDDAGETTDSVAAPTVVADGASGDVAGGDSDDLQVSVLDSSTTLKLTLQDYRLTLDGVVPSDEIKEAIEQRMGLVFAEFGASNLVVDPAAEPAPWLDGAPSLINTMILLHDGSIEITDQGVNVSGTALQSDFEKLQGALSSENGFPPITIVDQEVVDKEAPWLRAVATGDKVTLTGELADETMQANLVDGAIAVYGPENVTDETIVNPERHNRFLIMRFPSNLAAYKVFGEFDIRGENESFVAILESGLEFDILETELTAESKERLAAVMFTLTRNPLPVTVIGHTDDIGSEAANQSLSEARAESVSAFLVESGVLPENISATGRGESDPVANNRNQDGRAKNRRVEIAIGLYNE